MTPSNSKSLGSKLATLFHLDPDKMDDAVLMSIGAIAVKLCRVHVLEGLLEPTWEMIDEGYRHIDDGISAITQAENCWQAMITEALRTAREDGE